MKQCYHCGMRNPLELVDEGLIHYRLADRTTSVNRFINKWCENCGTLLFGKIKKVE